MTCTTALGPIRRAPADPAPYAWTDLTWLLHKNHVSWGYDLDHGAKSPANNAGVPAHWNVFAAAHGIDRRLPRRR